MADGASRDHPDVRPTQLAFACGLSAAMLLAALIFAHLTADARSSDILVHIRIAQNEFTSGRYFTYTVWSPLLMIVSAGGKLIPLRWAAVGLLTFCVAAKVLMVQRAMRTWGAAVWTAILVSLALVVAMPLPALGRPTLNGAPDSSPLRGAIYLGQLSPSLWHNSTWIASAAAVVGCAILGRRMLERDSTRDCAIFGVALALASLIKPSYALVVLPVFGVVLLGVGVRRRRVLLALSRGLLIAVPSGCVILVQFLLTKNDPFIVPSTFSIDWLVIWRYYSSCPPLSIVLSVVFPLLATIVALRRGEPWSWLLISWAVLGVGILQMAMLAERNRSTGELIYDGNWFWGAHSANLVLFVTCAAALSRSGRRPRGDTWLAGVAWGSLGLHVAAGALYIWRIYTIRVGFAT